MPTRALAELAEHVAARDGRLVLVGDRAQLPAIDAGGAFAALADRLGAATLTENRRQRDPLQAAVADALAEGRPHQALALLAAHGGLLSFAAPEDARAQLVEDWAGAALADPASCLILAHDRADVAALNALARAALDQEGGLGLERLVAHGREWAPGDRLVCRRNDYRPGLDVRNGTRGTVERVDPGPARSPCAADDGRLLQLPADYLSHAHHGYALTGHVSQGATVDRTFLLASPERGGAEWAYVAASRHRIDLRVYASAEEPELAAQALASTWERRQAKHLAIERLAAAERAAPAPERERATPRPGDGVGAGYGAANLGPRALGRAPGPRRAAGARRAARPGARAAPSRAQARRARAAPRRRRRLAAGHRPRAGGDRPPSPAALRGAAGSCGVCGPSSPARRSGRRSCRSTAASSSAPCPRRAPGRRLGMPGSAPRRRRSRRGSRPLTPSSLAGPTSAPGSQSASARPTWRPPSATAPSTSALARAGARPCASSRATACATASPTPSAPSGPSRPTRPAGPSTAGPSRSFARRAPRSSGPTPPTDRPFAPQGTSTDASTAPERPGSAAMRGGGPSAARAPAWALSANEVRCPLVRGAERRAYLVRPARGWRLPHIGTYGAEADLEGALVGEPRRPCAQAPNTRRLQAPPIVPTARRSRA